MNADPKGIGSPHEPSPEMPSALNVLTAIKHLQRDHESLAEIRTAYSLLSDLVHPNLGSHTTVVSPQVQEEVVNAWTVTPHPGPERGEFILILSVPAVASALGAFRQAMMGSANVVGKWAEMIDSGARVEFDLRG